ncbi:YjbE family putative metal transport protein [Caldovatus sp. SYSU G05006]|uniref:YjbE family putative metal transport protein n=1 Tax=Caldovatus aquaticus TaxID=2865671 RepID=A0ABS7F0B7_9PROT|nr:YjbE family putative metal transport protein [Caldovatus aquaticus]
MTALSTSFDLVVLGKILGVNIVLSGDNAVLIALAAAGLPAAKRGQAILFGMILAVVLRVLLSLAAVYLLEIPGLLLLGGAILLWIAWTFYNELREEDKAEEAALAGAREAPHKTMATALQQIVIADVSMSLDNVLAVAGAAVGNIPMLVLGLTISILMMGAAATVISRLMERYRWIAYVGVALIVWIGVEMIWHDAERLWGMWQGEAAGHAGLLLPGAAPPPAGHGADPAWPLRG